MADLSDKSLAILVIGALIIVAAGTAINLLSSNRSITGFLTSDTGNVSLYISSTLAIQVNSSFNLINYSTCTPRAGSSYWCATNDTVICDGTVANNCTGDTATPQYLQIDNVGNVNASVNITANDCAASGLIGGTGPVFAYITTHCNGTNVTSWTSFVAGAQQNEICSDLSFLGGQMRVYTNVTIPSDATGGSGSCVDNRSTITFTGTAAP